jgi:hypothetical protein
MLVIYHLCLYYVAHKFLSTRHMHIMHHYMDQKCCKHRLLLRLTTQHVVAQVEACASARH